MGVKALRFCALRTATREMKMPSPAKSAGMRNALARKAAAMPRLPKLLMSLTLALRITLMARAAWPVRMGMWSSRSVTFLTQNNRFSIAQRSRHRASSYAAVDDSNERLVTA